MRKERLFYLDFIRAIAAIAIVITHFNAYFLYYSPPLLNKVVITSTVSNIYIGDWGVSLFFIISGAALMYAYNEKLQLKEFFKKRFLSIYPMFWIGYIIAFLYLFYVNRGFFVSAPLSSAILTVFGFDGYLAGNIQTFYILGEWFLGCIVLIYILFPLLRKLTIEHPRILLIVAMIVYFIIIFYYNIPFAKAKFVFTRVPEVLMGMYFVKYIKKVTLPVAAIGLAILIANTLLKPQWDSSLQTTYVGISSFLLLTYVSQFIKLRGIRNICGIVGKYSYAIFLVHHVVITAMIVNFDLATISKKGSYVLFLACFAVICLLSKLLYELHRAVMKKIDVDFLGKSNNL